MLQLDIKGFKDVFFDSAKVLSAVDRATRRVLSRFGAFVRKTARDSIRPGKRPSRPGQPPKDRTGTLKRFIWFGYDPAAKTVVIGPAYLRRQSVGGDVAPGTLEHGARVLRRVPRGKRSQKVVSANYQARPYMAPALAKELPKLPAMWQDSVKP